MINRIVFHLRSAKSRFSKIILLSVLPLALTTNSYATSVYDGIWSVLNPPDQGVTYFSVVINDGVMLLVDMSAVAYFQDPSRGAYVGPVPLLNGTTIPRPPFNVNVTTEPLPVGRKSNGWILTFLSEKQASIIRPSDNNMDVLPPLTLKKIF